MSHISHIRPLSCRQLPFAASVMTLVTAGHAHASQGPGIAPGTASTSLQWTMTFAVYGLCATAVAAGVIGTLKKN